jgi:hypothetical protein
MTAHTTAHYVGLLLHRKAVPTGEIPNLVALAGLPLGFCHVFTFTVF